MWKCEISYWTYFSRCSTTSCRRAASTCWPPPTPCRPRTHSSFSQETGSQNYSRNLSIISLVFSKVPWNQPFTSSFRVSQTNMPSSWCGQFRKPLRYPLLFMPDTHLLWIREAAPQKMSTKVEKFQKGGGGQRPKSKSPQFKLWTTLRQEGVPDFQIFPKFKWLKHGLEIDNIWLIYWWDICQIWYIYGWYMIEIIPM